MHLSSPDIQSPRSVLADWLEVQALTSASGRIGRSALDSIYRLTAEERPTRNSRDLISKERNDGEIIEIDLESLIIDVVSELEWRQSKLGSAYPYQLRMTSSGRKKPEWELARVPEAFSLSQLIYVTCVLIVAFRRNMLSPSTGEEVHFTNHRIGLIFQICACLAIGGYIQGEVVSFGWPRAGGDAFLPALVNVWKRFGAYKIVPNAPQGAPESLKDGGVDIIAWRNFADNRPSRLILFGQVASGDNWVDKSAREPAEVLTGYWFAGPRPKYWLPATLMPFVAHEEVGLESSQDVASSIFGRMEYYEQAHGLIFDRIRIVESADIALDCIRNGVASIDGSDRVNEIAEWVRAVAGRTIPVDEVYTI